MKSPLVRFGVAIEADLLAELDMLVKERGGTRSEMFRDLARAAVGRASIAKGVEAVAALTIVYDHHVRDLSEKLTQLQHDLGDLVRSTMHVHLSHDYCLEVLVLRGRSDELASIAEQILATRGVKHGGIEIVPGVFADPEHEHDHRHQRKQARTKRKP
jgi:CopG family nickel-responsive transcriptional regulator